MPATSKIAVLRLAIATAIVAMLWAVEAIAQSAAPATSAALASPWLTPTAVYGGLTILAGAIGWIFRWSAGQDKRIDAAATKDELRKSIAEMKDAVTDLGKIVQSAQSRDSCALHRQEEVASLADVERGLSARMTVVERKGDRLAVGLEAIAASVHGVDEIRQMVGVLYQAGGFTPLPSPRPVPRQITQRPLRDDGDDKD